jgi:hypothetical protein
MRPTYRYPLKRNDARLAHREALTSAAGPTGHLILQILPSDFAGVQRRRLTDKTCPTKGDRDTAAPSAELFV